MKPAKAGEMEESMTGEFFITPEYLKELGPCGDGYEDFLKAFPNGGKYQDILDACAKERRVDYGQWLLDKIGPTSDIRKIEEIDDPEAVIIYAGALIIKNSVHVRYIEAGESIEAGDDYGIYAGVRVKISNWPQCATVEAQSKPDNLISGYWVEK